jgi:hypothetical protein
MKGLFESSVVRKRLVVGMLLVLGTALLLSAMRYIRPQATTASKPVLGLMTTLPLQWSEGGIEADLATEAKPHPAFERLQDRYEIVALDSFDGLGKRNLAVMLLAQPRAFAPAELVALDRWVRDGGRLLILADPALQWGSLYPLGDKRRPLFSSMLSPLFTHWGVELVLPMTETERDSLRKIGDRSIRTRTMGEWIRLGGASDARCIITPDPILADCRVGQGRALLFADADLLDAAFWKGQGIRALSGQDEFGNMELILAYLGQLQGKSF